MADLLDCCAVLDGPRVVTDTLPALATRLTADLREVLIDHLTATTLAHARTHTDGTWDWLTEEHVRTGLAGVYDATTSAGTIDDTIAEVVSAGLDGELITWEVITRESTKHEGLIHKECNKLARTLPDQTPEDLKGYGWAGLRVALRNFDPSLGYAFSTYACPRINGTIRDGVRAESPIPKRLTTFVRKVSNAEEQLTHQLGRSPSWAEIAEFIDEKKETMERLLPRLTAAASLEELSNPWGEKTQEPPCLIDPSDPEEEALTNLRNQALRDAVAALPEEERLAVDLLMLQEMPVNEAARQLGLEPRQLRARKNRGLRALAPVMAAWLDEHADATV